MGVADQLSLAPHVIPIVLMGAVVASMGTAVRRLISESSGLLFMSMSQRFLRIRFEMMASE